MNHEVFYDEASNLVVIRVKGKLTEDDIVQMSVDNHRYKKNYSLVLDLREATGMLDKKARHRLKLEYADNPPARTAIAVTNPAVRIVVNLIMGVSRDSQSTRFFESEDAAVGWLKVYSSAGNTGG